MLNKDICTLTLFDLVLQFTMWWTRIEAARTMKERWCVDYIRYETFVSETVIYTVHTGLTPQLNKYRRTTASGGHVQNIPPKIQFSCDKNSEHTCTELRIFPRRWSWNRACFLLLTWVKQRRSLFRVSKIAVFKKKTLRVLPNAQAMEGYRLDFLFY